ncbi:MAG: AAA family ATPase [Polyangiales bacterium]
MAKRAATIREAGYGRALRVERNVWAETGRGEETDQEFLVRYVERRGLGAEEARARGVPVHVRIARSVVENVRAKVLLTGQKGSGKSTELRHLTLDPDVRAHFTLLNLVVTERVDLNQQLDARFLFLLIAAELATTIAARPDAEWAIDDATITGRWIEVLRGLFPTEPPAAITSFKASAKYFAELVAELRSDEERRAELVRNSRYDLPQMERVVAELVGALTYLSKCPLLLVIDDGDKLAQETTARGIFITHAGSLLRLPCALVMTFPYWLHFEGDFNPVTSECTCVLLENVKVVTRDKPQEVIPGASQFFRSMLERLFVPGYFPLHDEALEEAVRFSAGIPREFLRIVERGFVLAEDFGEDALSLETLRDAIEEMSRHMNPFMQRQEVRDQLERISLTQVLKTAADWKLLDAMLVVELRNKRPWYNVHPLLAADVAEFVKRRARRVDPKSELDEESRRQRMIDELEGARGGDTPGRS